MVILQASSFSFASPNMSFSKQAALVLPVYKWLFSKQAALVLPVQMWTGKTKAACLENNHA
jgi:hypothetical protein